MRKPFAGFDLAQFWEDSDYARKEYVERPLSKDLIAAVEAELGVRLPASYLELMKSQNGGIPRNTRFPTTAPTTWAKDHVAITGIMGVGSEKTYSLCGELGSQFMQEEWGYPDIGICICDCPSAGHDMIMLDYRQCGRKGEPEVVHVDQEADHKITFLAKDFESFIRGLVNDSVYDTSAEDLKNDLNNIENGTFSKMLARMLERAAEPELGPKLRAICRKLTLEKGYFALHDDKLSYLVYDIQFYLYTKSNELTQKRKYLTAYPKMIALGEGEFTTGGYAPDFINDWFDKRLAKGEIVARRSGKIEFSKEYLQTLKRQLGRFK